MGGQAGAVPATLSTHKMGAVAWTTAPSQGGVVAGGRGAESRPRVRAGRRRTCRRFVPRCRNTARTRRDAGAGGSGRPPSRACRRVVVDEVLGEHVALRQELVVGFERGERLPERARHGRDLGQFLGRQVVDVLVDRVARVDPILDAVEAGHEHRREREIRIARRVGAAELDALGLGAVRVHRDANRGRAVAHDQRG